MLKWFFVQLLLSAIPASTKQLWTSQDQLLDCWCTARTALSTHKQLFVELLRLKTSIIAVCWQLSVKVWLLSGKKGVQLAMGMSTDPYWLRTRHWFKLDGRKAAICTTVFSWNHKSLLLFPVCSFVARLFAACCVTVWRVVLAVDSACYLLLFGLPTSHRRESDWLARSDSNWPFL